jgi:hypothetical protein
MMEAEQGSPDNGESGAPALRARPAVDTMGVPPSPRQREESEAHVHRTAPTSLHIPIQLEGQMHLYGEQYVVHRP